MQAETLRDLLAYHDLCVGGRELAALAEELCDRVVQGLRDALLDPTQGRPPAEAYTVFCLGAVDGVPAERLGAWAAESRADIASLLAQEPPGHLSDEQVAETTRYWLRYGKDDLVVVDWDAAMIVDLSDKFDDVLYMLELANLQLEQFRILDDRLDAVALRAYDDLERHYRGRTAERVPSRILADLRISRVDLTKMSDDLYSLVRGEIEARRMLLLEITIVALFVLDVVLLIWKG